MISRWYNFKTEKYDEFVDSIPLDFKEYISQEPSAQSLYELYIKMGNSPIESVTKVLEACIKK